VQVKGERPSSLRQEGDRAFERSRGEALREHDRILGELKSDRSAEKDLNLLIHLKTGHKPNFPALKDLPQLWAEIPRRKAPTPRYVAQCQATLSRFVEFVEEQQPGTVEMIQVTQETARAFMHHEEERGVSARTWNETLSVLRTTFKKLHPFVPEGSNPFFGLVTRVLETVNRKPFSPDELKAVLEECRRDEFIGPIIITGISTAMRRGDCCLLKWSDVNLEDGFIRVKTSKTGQTVEIPIFLILRDTLNNAARTTVESPHCFPQQAAMYRSNPDGITRRVKKVLARAMQATSRTERVPSIFTAKVQSKLDSFFQGLPESSKSQRMQEAFHLYASGKTMVQVAESLGISPSTVSAYMNQIEEQTECSIIRQKSPPSVMDQLQAEREHGQRKASIRDFHSFRVTWITLALVAGVPLEVVRRVSGHRTVDVVLKHYFHPGREDLRTVLEHAMPGMFGMERDDSNRPLLLRQAAEELEAMNQENWPELRDRVLEKIRKLQSPLLP
jgi:integrase